MTNEIAARAVRRVKEGTSAVLLQSGLNESWWADSMECYTYLRNVKDLLSDGKTPYERRFGQPFEGPTIPFGSLVEYHPITAKDQSRLHEFGKKVLLGIFFRCALYAGGIWKGDIVGADIEELENLDASEVRTRRLIAKEVVMPKTRWNFHVHHSNCLEEINLSKNPPQSRITLHEAKSMTMISKERWDGLNHWTSKLVTVKPETIFGWSRCLHSSSSRWTKSETQCAERRIIPNTTSILWRCQPDEYYHWCVAGKPYWWIVERWWWPRSIWALDRFRAVHKIKWKTSWLIGMVWESGWRKFKQHQDPIIYGQRFWQGREKQQRDIGKNEVRQCLCFNDPEDMEFKENMKITREKLESLMESVMPCKVRNLRRGQACGKEGIQFVGSLQSCTQVSSHAPSDENPRCESRCWQWVGKAWTNPSMAHE